MKYDTQKIVAAIKQAIMDATEAGNANLSDGGDSNLDYAYIQVPGMRETQVKEILAGVSQMLSTLEIPTPELPGLAVWTDPQVTSETIHGTQSLAIGYSWGQGNLRRRMAQAVCDSLAAAGFKANYRPILD